MRVGNNTTATSHYGSMITTKVGNQTSWLVKQKEEKKNVVRNHTHHSYKFYQASQDLYRDSTRTNTS